MCSYDKGLFTNYAFSGGMRILLSPVEAELQGDHIATNQSPSLLCCFSGHYVTTYLDQPQLNWGLHTFTHFLIHLSFRTFGASFIHFSSSLI